MEAEAAVVAVAEVVAEVAVVAEAEEEVVVEAEAVEAVEAVVPGLQLGLGPEPVLELVGLEPAQEPGALMHRVTRPVPRQKAEKGRVGSSGLPPIVMGVGKVGRV